MATDATKTALVTGGTGSVGESLVMALAQEGYKTTFLYHRSVSRARRLAQATGANALRIDLREAVEVPDAEVDILINCAAINKSSQLTGELPLADWERTIDLNLTVPFRLIQQCLPYMMRRRWGRIVNISSIYAMRAVEGNLPYTVSKHGLSGLTKTVAREYAMFGITCNEICPGPVRSRMLRRVCRQRADEAGVSLRDYMKEVREELPTQRLVEPSEIARMAMLLVSEESGCTNGAAIVMDGGMIA